MIDAAAQEVLGTLINHEDYMSQLEVIADMGSGAGHHSLWWAEQQLSKMNKTRSYTVLAVDDVIAMDNRNRRSNIKQIRKDWNDTGIQSNKVDLIWCHDSFHLSVDPFATLRHWNQVMSENGMLLISLKQNAYIDDLSRWQVELQHSCYYSWTMTMLIRMLATSGFDCREGFLRQRRHDPYMWAAVYKSKHAPMDRRTTSWYDLLDKKLTPVTIDQCIMKLGYVKQEHLILEWLDHQRYDLAVEMMP